MPRKDRYTKDGLHFTDNPECHAKPGQTVHVFHYQLVEELDISAGIHISKSEKKD